MQDIFVFLVQNTFGTEIYLLPTLSMRRATLGRSHSSIGGDISIHALHAESDLGYPVTVIRNRVFLSTLSMRRATTDIAVRVTEGTVFLSTLSMRRATAQLFPLL